MLLKIHTAACDKYNRLQKSCKIATTQNMSATTVHSTESASLQLQEAERNAAAKSDEATITEAQNVLVTKLEQALLKRTDLVVDFSSLKSCFEPLIETQETAGEETEFAREMFDKTDSLPQLQSLVVRRLDSPAAITDNYIYLWHGMLQLSSLTELDISGNAIHSTIQPQLQLWNLYNVKKLNMDSTSLTVFPASVGRLRKLEHLSLGKNQLKDLPVTLGFCENLEVLNLQGNRFNTIPGVVLHLKKLKELRRLDNPLKERWTLGTTAVSITNKAEEKKAPFNPDSLQELCTKTAFTNQINYWQQEHQVVAPLQCKTLDRLAAVYTVCEICHSAVAKPTPYGVQFMMVSFCELKGVPFTVHTCSKICQDEAKSFYTRLNTELEEMENRRYHEMIKKAQKMVNSNTVDISPDAINAPKSQVERFNPTLHTWRASNYHSRRHRRKCAIM